MAKKTKLFKIITIGHISADLYRHALAYLVDRRAKTIKFVFSVRICPKELMHLLAMVDVEQLITLIYERKPLWDVGSKSYHNRDVARKLWLEVATELNSTSK